MKKSLFLIPCLAAALWSCSDKDVVDNPGTSYGTEGENSYLSVSISGVSDSATRDAAGDPSDNHPYNDGIFNEWEVSEVTFVFFDNVKNVVKIAEAGTSFYTTVPTTATEATGTDEESGNVTALTGATLVLKTSGTLTADLYMAAIVNPSQEVKTAIAGITNYEGLKAITDTKYLSATGGKFQMSSSVYAVSTDNNNPIGLLNVKDNLKTTEAEAKKVENRAHVYVERVAAKVSVTIDNDLEPTQSGLYKLANASLENVKFNDPENKPESNDVYLKLLGWNVTADAAKSFTVKNVDDKWFTAATYPDNGDWSSWFNAGNKRSFWAVNPSGLTYNYSDFDDNQAVQGWKDPELVDDSENGGKKLKDGETINWTYMLENAVAATAIDEPGDGNTATPTKVIVEGQLCDSEGNELSLVEYAGTIFAYEEESEIIEYMANTSRIYVKSTREVSGTDGTQTTEDVYTPIATEDYIEVLDLVPYLALKQKSYADGLVNGRYKDQNYYTFLEYNGEWDNDTNKDNYYIGTGDNAVKITSEAQFNQALIANAGPAKIWSEGMTYYFVEIKHLNTGDGKTKANEGYYGVVRNHWYEVNVTKIAGLGTPVYDNGQVIYPQTPDEDPWSYLYADIRILSWHKVQNNYELGK